MNKNVKEKINNVEIDNDNLSNLKKQIIEMVEGIKSEDYLFKICHYILPKYKRDKKETGN